jgi:imidazolonepropionase-like amidohydrolase
MADRRYCDGVTTVGRTALRDVRVFDGQGLTEPRTVVIDGAVIGADATGAEVVDAAGGVLLPGLIDAHIHPEGREALAALATHGVTTGLTMATWPAELVASLRDVPGLTDIRSAGLPAIGPGGLHARMPGLAERAVVLDPALARQFVADRVAEGIDYLKIMLEAPGDGGLPADVAVALVAAAREHGLTVVAHAGSQGAYTMALDVGVDVITHLPLGAPLADGDVARIVDGGHVVIPTLEMMRGLAGPLGLPPGAYDVSARGVGVLHAAGVPILAGTDANVTPGVPYQPAFGSSLHDELARLVEAGLSTAAALRAATSLPAKHFGLSDRGAVEPGLRADLVLVDGDPLADISATRAIRRVWLAGVERVIRRV